MADTTLNRFVAQVADAAERAAFVPSPPTPASGPDSGYFLYQQDDGSSWTWDSDGSAWVPVSGAGGVVPSTVQGDILYASGANTLAALAKDTNATRYLANTGASNNPAWAQVAVSTGISGLGTGVATALGVNVGSAGAPVVLNGALGTPSSGVATNLTGLPLTTGVTGILPVANGGTGSASGAAILVTTVTLTDAQIKALPTTPITLVAAPGAGFRVKPISCTVFASATVAVYTNINTTYCVLSLSMTDNTGYWNSVIALNDSTTTPTCTGVTDLLGGSIHDSVVDAQIPYIETSGDQWAIQVNVTTSLSGIENKALVICVDNNGSGAFTGGDAFQHMLVTLYYRIEAIA